MTSRNGLTFWFTMLVLIVPIHMVEQFLFGLDTLDEARALLAGYLSNFDNPDVGTALLVGAVVTFVQSMLLAVLAGGRWRFFPAVFFGVSALVELHHIAQVLLHGSYFPGSVTALPFAFIGVMLLRAVVREWDAPQAVRA